MQGVFRAELAHCPSAVRFVQHRLLPTLEEHHNQKVLSGFFLSGPTWSHNLPPPLTIPSVAREMAEESMKI